jgi:hypothetical protein
MSSIIRPSAQNAWDQAAKNIQRGVDYRMQKFFSLKYFTWEQKGGIGDELVFDTVVIPGSEGATRPAYQPIVDGMDMKGRQFRVPWTGKEKEISVEKLAQVQKMGAMSAQMSALADESMIPMEKLAWQGAALATEGVLIHGFSYNGAGTIDDPKYLDGGSTNGKWDVAGKAFLDLTQLHSAVAKPGFDDIALFYPQSAVEAMDMPLTLASGIYSGTSVKQAAQNIFEGGVYPILDDLASTPLCCMTGAAEAATNFQLFAVSLSGCSLGYTAKPGFEAVPFDVKKNIGTYRHQGRFVPMTVVKKIGSYYYKPVAEIDSIDWNT